MFHNSFDYFILGKTIPEIQFYVPKLDMFTFYACNKMYIKAAAGSNNIKITYFRKIDFEYNLFTKNCVNLLSTISFSITGIMRNNRLEQNENSNNTQ